MSRERESFQGAVTAQRVVDRLRTATDDPDSDTEYTKMVAFLDQNMKKLKKGSAWWLPPHNFVLNSALMNLNCWYFSILPFRSATTAYRQKSDRLPEGIVIDPNWKPFQNSEGSHVLAAAEHAFKMAKTHPSVSDSVKRELEVIENHFKVQIPPSVASTLIGQSLKIAERRWGTDGLRRKKILVPFDGSKSIPLGSWD